MYADDMPLQLPSMKSGELFRILSSLGYTETRRKGSHRRMSCEGRPSLTFAFHDEQTIPPGLVRKILVKDIGLTEEQILGFLG